MWSQPQQGKWSCSHILCTKASQTNTEMTYFDNSLIMVLEYGKCTETSIIILFQPKRSLVTLPPPEAARLAGPLVGGPHGAVHGVRAAGPVINVAPPPACEVKLLAVTTSPVQMGDTLALTCNDKKEQMLNPVKGLMD